VPRKTFADLYSSLDNGVADYLLAPVENTIAGVVQPSVDSAQLKFVKSSMKFRSRSNNT
jgi:prephenate dehydratase